MEKGAAEGDEGGEGVIPGADLESLNDAGQIGREFIRLGNDLEGKGREIGRREGTAKATMFESVEVPSGSARGPRP